MLSRAIHFFSFNIPIMRRWFALLIAADGNIWTEAEAIEDYTDQTGGEHAEIHYMKFDALSSEDLAKFIKRGNT